MIVKSPIKRYKCPKYPKLLIFEQSMPSLCLKLRVYYTLILNKNRNIMKKLLIGAAAGIGLALVIYKLAESGKLDCVCDDLNKLSGQAKKKIKDGIDVGKNQLEYLKERAAYKSEQLSELADEVEKKVLDKLNKAKS